MKDPLVVALERLITREGGREAVADEIGSSEQTLYQIVKGVKDSKTGTPKGVGPSLRKRLDARYAGWRFLADDADHLQQPLELKGIGAAKTKSAVQLVAPGYVRLPILAEASAGPGADHDGFELVEHVDVAEEWVRRTLRANPSQLRVLTARGHSMTGQVEDGDVMFVEPCIQFVDDGLYVIAVGGLLRVKRLRLRVTDHVLSIESNDGSSPETLPLSHVDDTLRICGRVIGAWSLKRL